MLGIHLASSICVLHVRHMVKEIKVRQVGGSVGATLPKDMTERLHLAGPSLSSCSVTQLGSGGALAAQRTTRTPSPFASCDRKVTVTLPNVTLPPGKSAAVFLFASASLMGSTFSGPLPLGIAVSIK